MGMGITVKISSDGNENWYMDMGENGNADEPVC